MTSQLNNHIKFGKKEELDVSSRYLLQTAERAMKGDIVRGLVELITNADDSYCTLEDQGQKVSGKIVISIEKRKKGKWSIIKVQDQAEGMTLEEMMEKLRRVSRKITSRFMKTRGRRVRGLMGRGSKECVVFGKLVYQSIKNGIFAEIHIEKSGNEVSFIPIKQEKANLIHRIDLNIPKGNGTLVILEVEPTKFKIPTHKWLTNKLPKYYSLRDIASSTNRRLILIRANGTKGEENLLKYKPRDGRIVLDEQITIPNYPEAEVHLVVNKASKRVKVEESSPYWEGGVVVKSSYAIHGITAFSRDIANNPHFEFYFGRLECPYIDILAFEYEESQRDKKNQRPENPCQIIDPLRSEGLSKDHPFTKALYKEVVKHIKFLLKKDEEAAKQRTREIENEKTRNRHKKLAKAASKFIKQHIEDMESFEDENYLSSGEIPSGGIRIVPAGLKIPINEERKFYIYCKSPAAQGEKHAIVSTESEAIQLNPSIVGLAERGDGILNGCFLVKGLTVERDIKIKVKWGNIESDMTVAVIPEKEFRCLESKFQFEKKNYTVREGKQKKIRIIAKWPEFIHGRVKVPVTLNDNDCCKLSNNSIILDYDRRGIEIFGRCTATGTVTILGLKACGPVAISATLQDQNISTKIRVIPKKELGTNFDIKIVDEDLGEQRAVLIDNLLKINGQHKIIKRYLGPQEQWDTNQNSIHFRLLIAELIADTVSRRVLELNAQKNIHKYADMDVTGFYKEHRKYMKDFLEDAHQIQIPNHEIKE